MYFVHFQFLLQIYFLIALAIFVLFEKQGQGLKS